MQFSDMLRAGNLKNAPADKPVLLSLPLDQTAMLRAIAQGCATNLQFSIEDRWKFRAAAEALDDALRTAIKGGAR